MIKYLYNVSADIERTALCITMDDYYVREERKILGRHITAYIRRRIYARCNKHKIPFANVSKMDNTDLIFEYLIGDERFMKEELYNQSDKNILSATVRKRLFTDQLTSESFHQEKSYFEKYGEPPFRTSFIGF